MCFSFILICRFKKHHFLCTANFEKGILTKKAFKKHKKLFENLVDYKNEVFLQSQN
jgi:hypothetical protein